MSEWVLCLNFFKGYLTKFADGLSWLVILSDAQCAGTAENNQVQQRVGAEAVSAVHRRASSFTGRVQSGNNDVLSVRVGDNLSSVVGRNATHVVMHSGQNGNRFASNIDAGEDHGRF